MNKYRLIDKKGLYVKSSAIQNIPIKIDDFLNCSLVSDKMQATLFYFEDAVIFKVGLERITSWKLNLIKATEYGD